MAPQPDGKLRATHFVSLVAASISLVVVGVFVFVVAAAAAASAETQIKNLAPSFPLRSFEN